jgi:hypothetical protein
MAPGDGGIEAIQFLLHGFLDCFVASAPRNDGERLPPSSPRHCERSEAIQKAAKEDWIAFADQRSLLAIYLIITTACPAVAAAPVWV